MLITHKGQTPVLDESNFIAENASVIGKVSLKGDANVWFGAVIRGDVESIEIGCRSNVQDNSVIHTSKGFPTTIGEDVTIGHGAIVHGCTIGNRVLVGMGAIILDGAKIGDDCMIGAGTLIPPGKEIPANSLVVGSPGKVVRELNQADRDSLVASALRYVAYSKEYK